MMATSKEFEDLDAAQEAIRRWREGRPGKEIPEFLLRRLAKAHDAARQMVMSEQKPA